MKAQHLRFNCLHKQVLLPASARFFRRIKFFLPLLVLAACTGAPKDDRTTPPSLYLPQKSIEASPKGGYKVNMVTGQALEPLTTDAGKKIITVIPIPTVGKRINPDSVPQPKLVMVGKSPRQIDIWKEVFTAEGDIDYQWVAQTLKRQGIRPHLAIEQCIEPLSPQTIDVVSAHKQNLMNVKKVFGR